MNDYRCINGRCVGDWSDGRCVGDRILSKVGDVRVLYRCRQFDGSILQNYDASGEYITYV